MCWDTFAQFFTAVVKHTICLLINLSLFITPNIHYYVKQQSKLKFVKLLFGFNWWVLVGNTIKKTPQLITFWFKHYKFLIGAQKLMTFNFPSWAQSTSDQKEEQLQHHRLSVWLSPGFLLLSTTATRTVPQVYSHHLCFSLPRLISYSFIMFCFWLTSVSLPLCVSHLGSLQM